VLLPYHEGTATAITTEPAFRLIAPLLRSQQQWPVALLATLAAGAASASAEAKGCGNPHRLERLTQNVFLWRKSVQCETGNAAISRLFVCYLLSCCPTYRGFFTQSCLRTTAKLATKRQ